MEQKVEGSKWMRIAAESKREGQEILGMEKFFFFLINSKYSILWQNENFKVIRR